MKNKTKIIIGMGALVLLGAGAWFFFGSTPFKAQGFRYITRPVGYNDIAASVQETGTINPVNEVNVGTEVSGTVTAISVDYNSRVKSGQLLCRIDPTNYQSAVDSSQASLNLAKANLHSSEVSVDKAKAELDMANLTVTRDEALAKQNLINQNQVDLDRTAAVAALQDYYASQASVESSKAQVQVSQGQLDQAKYSLTKTIIRSPIDGIVLSRAISVGQTVAASLQTPTLFTLASNLTDMQVDTSVDEADAGVVKEGSAAVISVTAFPNVTFPGVVTQVRVNPNVVSNVVTYDAVVSIHDKSGRLFPGMTAQVTISTEKRTHVLTVPLPALLFNPQAATGSSSGAAGGARPAGGGSGSYGGGMGGGGFGGMGGGYSAGVVQTQTGSQALAGAPGSKVTLWVLQDGQPQAVSVIIGISDGKNVEIAKGDLAEGDQVIVAQRRNR